MSLIFSNLVVIKTLSSNHRMYNLYAKFVKILEICKQCKHSVMSVFDSMIFLFMKVDFQKPPKHSESIWSF